MSTREYDVIAAEVHRKAVQNLSNEMAITLVRTSGSPIVTASKDFSTCLMDETPEHLSFSAFVLVHLASSLIGTQTISGLVDASDLRPGDGWIVNDPHSAGACHQGDVSVIMPTFYDGQHLGWSFANMHLIDTGGVGVSGYAPGARDVYQEGLRFPPVRIIRDGAIDREWNDFIAANVRLPGPVLNDIRSMIAANNTAAKKLEEIVDEFGLERHRAYCAINNDLTETVLRERISHIPDGVYESVEWAEFDGHDGPDLLMEVRLQLEVDDSDLRFSFSTDVAQVDSFINSTPGGMIGQSMAAVVTTLLFGDVPINGGLWRPITYDLGEPGTIINSQPPAAVSAAHTEVGLRACRMTRDVLSQALALSDEPTLRGRVSGQCADAFPACALFGPNQHGGASVIFYPDNCMGAGGPAQTVHDGQDAYGVTNATGAGIPDIENHEAADPVLFLWRRLVPNSGGPGQMRGGQALDQACAIYGVPAMGGPSFNTCAQIPARGFGGGYPPSAGTCYPVYETNVQPLLDAGVLPTRERLVGRADVDIAAKVAHLVLAEGEVFVSTSGGGGGLGDPLLRPVDEVVKDVAAGYVTTDHAASIYGVVFDDDARLDVDATAHCRQDLRAARIGGPPAAELSAPDSVGVAVALNADGWTCASCHHVLADAQGDWRSGASLTESPLKARLAELDMFVRGRSEPPVVVMREYFCPQCAASLSADISTDIVAPIRSRVAGSATPAAEPA